LNTSETSARRKQLAGKAMASQHRYRNLVDNALIGIADVRTDGQIVYCNPAGLRMVEYNSLEEVRKKNVIEL